MATTAEQAVTNVAESYVAEGTAALVIAVRRGVTEKMLREWLSTASPSLPQQAL